jgi:hypothetical protein
VLYGVQNIVAATEALEELKQSPKFSKLLEIVLLLGNYMNAGSRQEQSVGFELNFLVKVSDVLVIQFTIKLQCHNELYQVRMMLICALAGEHESARW